MSGPDDYSAVAQLRPERYAGEIRNIHSGQVGQCPHAHKRRSLAAECARRMLAPSTPSQTA